MIYTNGQLNGRMYEESSTSVKHGPDQFKALETLLMVYRRHEIYQIACEHDLIILEDDAYYFLQV